MKLSVKIKVIQKQCGNMHTNQLVGKGSKTTQIQHLKVNDSVLSKNEDIAGAFNTYFVKIGDNILSQIPRTNVCIEEFIEPL